MTAQQQEKAIAEIWEMFRRTDERLDKLFRETDERRKETDRQLKELGKQIGGLGSKFGGFTEGMAFPSMHKILTEKFKMEVVGQRVESRKNGDILEVDVLAYSNGEAKEVYVVEVKSKLREDNLQEMLRDLEKFPRFFPEHKDKALYGIIAAVDVSKQMKQKVLKAGLYLALIKDDVFSLDVPEGFEAKTFN